MANAFKDVNWMDGFLILITLWLVFRTCSKENEIVSSEIPTVGDASKGDVSDAAELVVQPGETPPLPEAASEEEELPEGMPAGEAPPTMSQFANYERFGNCDENCPEGAPSDVCKPCEKFGQPTPAPIALSTTEKKCPASLVYTAKHLPTADTEEGCWPGSGPSGNGSVTGKCIQGGNAKVANFFDAAQTQTVLDAIDRDPTREMKIRQAPATANYDLRASPPIKFNGYPSMSFIKGNANTGLQTA
tara:strand:- start:221 stop:958 length:738 start_codon:yes stop_codon:yes gene_type:complete